MAVAVVRDRSVVVLLGFGVSDISSGSTVTPPTPFYIASSTKSFMGVASVALAVRGVWSQEDPIARWLPQATLPEPLSTRTPRHP
jgi:CubicO group peptidase (beta-lactamase class C family)